MDTTLSSLKIPLLTRDGNYRHWAAQMQAMLTIADELDVMLLRVPVQDNVVENRRDIVCKAKLQLHVSGPLKDIVARAPNAKAAWDALHAEYLGSLHARRPRLMAELNALEQGRSSLMEYIDRAKGMREQFEELGMEASLALLCQKFIQGLRSNIQQACGAMVSTMLRADNVDLDDICSALRDMVSFIPGGGEAHVHATRGIFEKELGLAIIVAKLVISKGIVENERERGCHMTMLAVSQLLY
jgi:hypothetical protein